MKEEFVSYSQAVALKECGFDMKQWRGENYVEKIPGTEKEEWDDEECQWVTTYDIKLYPKLRLDQAQKWLREVHKLSVEPTSNVAGQWNVSVSTIIVCGETLWSKIGFDTYESALSAGLDAALGLIKQK